jgi:ribosomal protein L11 methyltransferase
VTIGPDRVDEVSGRLWLAGATAVGEVPEGDEITLVASFDEPAEAESAAIAVAGEAVDVDSGPWLDAWREFAEPVRSGRLLVVPAWLTPPPSGPDTVVVNIDPGRVFGHGAHPTTRLLLEELDRRVTGGEQVLDVGCGSGVLAVAAARLGAGEVVAIDIDPAAAEVTRANAAANGVTVDASTTPVADVLGTFDIVLANIGATVLREMAAELQARVAPGGVLVLSGLLSDRWEDVAACYAGTATRTELDGWISLVMSTTP